MAGFFDTLFGGGAEREAADKNRALLQQYGQTGNTALDTGLTQSTGALNTGAGNAAGLLGNNTGLYGGLRDAGTGYLNSGLNSSLGALNQGGQAWEPLSALAQKYGTGTSTYMDSLGVNGPAGNQRAVDAFQSGPGYDFARDQGLDAINRRRAAGGMLNSGNADLDAIKYGTGLANQEYGNWQTKLAGLINPELSATSGAATGMAGNARDISALYSNDALARLGLEQGVTQGQAGVNTGLAQNQVALGNSLSGVYGQDAANRVGIQSGITTGGISANNTQAAGEAAGAKNLLGAGMNLASMAAGLPPGTFTNMFGGGSSGSGAALGSMNIGGKLYPKFEQA